VYRPGSCANVAKRIGGLRQAGSARVVRGLPSFVLLLSLLAPCVNGLFLALSAGEAQCSLTCCKRSKKCCCQKSAQQPDDARPYWDSAECPSGCRQSPAVFAAAPAIIEREISHHKVRPCAPLFHATIARRQTSTRLPALFQRPPPVT